MIRDEEFKGAEKLLSEYQGMVRRYKKNSLDVDSLDDYYRAAIEDNKYRQEKITAAANRFIGSLKKEIIGEAFGKAFEMMGQKYTAPDTQAAEELPPIFQAVLTEGLLKKTPENGKYCKEGDKKDMDIIKWIFDYSGYGDSLTAELYMQYIQTQCKATTIQDYITRLKREAR
jgi:hypothetical protein